MWDSIDLYNIYIYLFRRFVQTIPTKKVEPCQISSFVHENSLKKYGMKVGLFQPPMYLGVEPKIGGFYPQNGWFYFMKTPRNKWMIWG